MKSHIDIGIVADWLVAYAGAEKVIKEFIDLYPGSELYSVVDFLSDTSREQLHNKKAKTTFIQKLPFSKTKNANQRNRQAQILRSSAANTI